MSTSRANFRMFKDELSKIVDILTKFGSEDSTGLTTVPVDFVNGDMQKYVDAVTAAGLVIKEMAVNPIEPMASPAGHPIAGYLRLELHKVTTETVH